MELSSQAESIFAQINPKTKLGDLRKIAKDVKKDHRLAMEIWSAENFLLRLFSILIMDNKLLSQDLINKLNQDMQKHSFEERNQLIDWLMANQLSKDKKTIALMESWEKSDFSLQRRIFWYYQARLRWVGQTPPPNTEELLTAVEKQIENEKPEVQWAMNLTAGWIGVYDKKYRSRCIEIGKKTGLYKGELVSKGCTPNYLPEFIAMESNKRNFN
jgi:3-methyladenine DNA glycosylase AlkD